MQMPWSTQMLGQILWNFFYQQIVVVQLSQANGENKPKKFNQLTEEKSKTLILRETPAVANNSSSRSNSML